MIIPHSKSIRLPRFSRRIPFCVDTRMIRWNFPYIESNYKTERELYTWDYRNRLTSVTKQTYNAETGTWENVQIVEYTYDYNNVWIRKTLDSNGDGTADSKSIFIPENYQTVLQLDDTNLTDANAPAVSHHYLWTPGQQDKLLADVTTEDILWALTDHLGSIRDIIQSTESGVITQAHIIYDAYGNVISCKNSEGQTVNNPLLFSYTGKAFDTDTALQNNINRWYDASIGRWLSTDPIGFEGNDTNLYRYVSNTPNLSLDYNGFIEKPDGMILSVPNKNLPIFETIVLKSTETIFPKHSEDWSAFSCYNIKYTYKIQSVSSIDYSECNFFLDIMHPAYRSVFMKKSKQYIEQLSSLILPLKQNCSTKEECKNQKNVEGGDNTQQVMQILTFTMRDDRKIYVTLKVQVLFNTTMYYEGQVGDCC